MSGTIYVISCGIGVDFPLNDILPKLESCSVLAGSRSLLSSVTNEKTTKIYFDQNTVSQVEQLITRAEKGENILVLASGDSLLQGIGRTVLRLATDKNVTVEIEPGVTAFQALYSRINLPWSDARFFSVHSGENLPCRDILSCSTSSIYGGNKLNAAEIAAELCRYSEQSRMRKGVLADRIGTDEEQIIRGTLAELSEKTVSPTSILLLIPPSDDQKFVHQLGEVNSFYSRENELITSPEVRAVAISKLRLPYEGVVWDIGAGSGSVGVEIGALAPKVSVHSVEQKSARIADIKENICRSGIVNVTVHTGNATEIIPELPSPDRVFIGGGGASIISILEQSYEKLTRGGRVVLTAVATETIQRVSTWNRECCLESITMDISRQIQLGKSDYSLYRPDNRITIFVWEKK